MKKAAILALVLAACFAGSAWAADPATKSLPSKPAVAKADGSVLPLTPRRWTASPGRACRTRR
ncbi:MAG: hypothetical protein M0C28_11895 [Candidatus Moduliflexus flocculans]|nr:hypothetical protein [Candidatus Moduliflexus flocculans]